MDYYDYGFKPYVSVGARRAQAARELAKLQKKGRRLSPVVIDGRTIADTFWGKAWCDSLERYSDFANRLPRGRTYVRNGSVVDDDLSEMFGIEMAPATAPKPAAASGVATKRSTSTKPKASSGQSTVTPSAKAKTSVSGRPSRRQRLTAAKRQAIAERMRTYWAARRVLMRKRKASDSS